MEMKEAYQQKADAQLREWQATIAVLRTDEKQTSARLSAEQQRMVQHLEDCYHYARVCLEELRISREERWELAKQAVERAMIDLKKALDESGASRVVRPIPLQSSRARLYEKTFDRKG